MSEEIEAGLEYFVREVKKDGADAIVCMAVRNDCDDGTLFTEGPATDVLIAVGAAFGKITSDLGLSVSDAFRILAEESERGSMKK